MVKFYWQWKTEELWRSLSQSHFVYRKSYMDWPGERPCCHYPKSLCCSHEKFLSSLFLRNWLHITLHHRYSKFLKRLPQTFHIWKLTTYATLQTQMLLRKLRVWDTRMFIWDCGLDESAMTMANSLYRLQWWSPLHIFFWCAKQQLFYVTYSLVVILKKTKQRNIYQI